MFSWNKTFPIDCISAIEKPPATTRKRTKAILNTTDREPPEPQQLLLSCDIFPNASRAPPPARPPPKGPPRPPSRHQHPIQQQQQKQQRPLACYSWRLPVAALKDGCISSGLAAAAAAAAAACRCTCGGLCSGNEAPEGSMEALTVWPNISRGLRKLCSPCSSTPQSPFEPPSLCSPGHVAVLYVCIYTRQVTLKTNKL